LVTRQLIKDISLANALHKATEGGENTAGLARPRPLYHTCGLAVALFIMVLLAEVFYVHYEALAARYGVLVRSAVRPSLLATRSALTSIRQSI
jgi:hypothetical protein